MKKGFSLVELSIVLIVIGLLVSVVTVSTRLIGNTKVRMILQETENLKAAINTFVSTYDENPGDFSRATEYFTDVANGDGDKIIEYDAIIESAYAWEHMVAGKVFEGSFDGTMGDGGKGSIPITNAPTSKYSGDACYTFTGDIASANASEFTGMPTGQNNFTLGGRWYDNPCIAALITPADADSVDNKIDDGKPATGRVRGYGGQANASKVSPAGSASSSTNCLNSGKYKVATESAECVLSFIF